MARHYNMEEAHLTTHVTATAKLHDDKNWCVKVYVEERMPDGTWKRQEDRYTSTLTTSSPTSDQSIWDTKRLVIEEIPVERPETATSSD